MCSNFSAIPTQLTRKGPLGANRLAFGTEAHEGLELKCARERMAEKMVGNGWEWLIDLGQGPVRTERKNGMRLRLRR